MTQDKVTLRLNALIGMKVIDAAKSVMVCADPLQTLYRTAQLALRFVIGVCRLDEFLTGKDDINTEWEAQLHERVADLGLEIVSEGIRDVVLPGDMKVLMNKVTEALRPLRRT